MPDRPTENEVREWLARLVNSGTPDATLAIRVCEDWLRTREALRTIGKPPSESSPVEYAEALTVLFEFKKESPHV